MKPQMVIFLHIDRRLGDITTHQFMEQVNPSLWISYTNFERHVNRVEAIEFYLRPTHHHS